MVELREFVILGGCCERGPPRVRERLCESPSDNVMTSKRSAQHTPPDAPADLCSAVVSYPRSSGLDCTSRPPHIVPRRSKVGGATTRGGEVRMPMYPLRRDTPRCPAARRA